MLKHVLLAIHIALGFALVIFGAVLEWGGLPGIWWAALGMLTSGTHIFFMVNNPRAK